MQKDFYTIGHITNDLEPSPHVGGGVTYSSVVAQRLGFQAHIITKCAVDSPYIEELEAMGIRVHVLPIRDQKFVHKTTAFRNRYDKKGNRTQLCPEVAEYITKEDLVHFPDISRDAIVLVAPVVGEVTSDVLEYLSKKGNIAATPQGYFRHIDEKHVVHMGPPDSDDLFSFVDRIILSIEDLSFSPGGTYLEELKKRCNIVVCTKAEKGSSIFIKGKDTVQVPAFTLSENEIVDYTGSGDSYAASFLIRKAEGATLEEAGYFASFYAAMKISGLGGKGNGLVTIPSSQEVNKYIQFHHERMEGFTRFHFV